MPITQQEFQCIKAANGVQWRRSQLLHNAGILHGFSTRIGGVSAAPFHSLNLGLADALGAQDAWQHVQQNWRLFMQAVNMHERTLVRVRQVHGTTIVQPDRDAAAVRMQPPFADGDAIVTGDRSHALSVRVADCAPVLLADAHAGVVAAVHAGWRGVARGIVPAAVRMMMQRGARADQILVAVGPCIGADSFQVGDEVAQAMRQAKLFTCLRVDERNSERWLMDMPRAILEQLAQVGIESSKIQLDDWCTLKQTDAFSFRREGARSGRAACIIGL